LYVGERRYVDAIYGVERIAELNYAVCATIFHHADDLKGAHCCIEGSLKL